MSTPGDARAFHARRVAEFRANGGKLNPPLDTVPLLVLTTTGAGSGGAAQHPHELQHRRRPPDRRSPPNGGAPTNPAWYHNLLANPEVIVELGGDTFQARYRPGTRTHPPLQPAHRQPPQLPRIPAQHHPPTPCRES